MNPTPAPSPLTTLDYAANVSNNSDIALVVLVTLAVLVLLCLGILVVRSIG